MTEDEVIGEVIEHVGGAQRLSDMLQLSRRNVLRYANGSNWVPRGVWAMLEELLAKRAAELAVLRDQVKTARAASEQHYAERTWDRDAEPEAT